MSKKNPAVSVIVAMYNAEEFVGECLTSLANQTFKDFEVIVVDDCSTDNSRAVVGKFYAHFGDRLTLMTLSPNSGRPGIPRNFAIAEAHGKYVYFLDSDDFLTETALSELYYVAEKFKADVVHPEKSFAIFPVGGQIRAETVSFQDGDFVTRPTLETFDICERLTGFVNKKFTWWACNKLFRRQFLLDNKIVFPATQSYEDFVFFLRCLVAAKNYVRVPFVSYYYRIREDSLSHKTYDALTFSGNAIDIFRELDTFMIGEKFFRDNPQYKYPLLDFFMQGQLDMTAKGFFVLSDLKPADVYNFFREKIFSANPQDNAALTSYLFVAMNLLKARSSETT